MDILQHWHLYQPRLNDKWTQIINEECYMPNAKNGIFRYINFNVGPTLVNWLQKHDPKTLELMVNSDHGQAMGQPYNHRIMPLIRYDEDLKTQIIWGKKHFKHVFGRDPKGMWLPECATDKKTCRELAKQGIEYTIGAPWQQKNVQDTTKPYRIKLGGDLEIIYFFYNDVSGQIAYNHQMGWEKCKWLENVDATLEELSLRAKDKDMMLLAYDGETFGHHHKQADKWAAYFPMGVNKRKDMKIITIDEYLKNNKREKIEIGEITENSAWSCKCGNLQRWSTGCNCAGGHKQYQYPMLQALQKVEDKIHEVYESKTGKYFKDPWEARNNYIDILLGVKSKKEFLNEHLKKEVKDPRKLFTLLEAEYLNQTSFTSCGWFFSDMSIQAEQNMIDSYNAVQKVEYALGDKTHSLKKQLVKDLEDVRDYRIENGQEVCITGKDILKRKIIYFED